MLLIGLSNMSNAYGQRNQKNKPYLRTKPKSLRCEMIPSKELNVKRECHTSLSLPHPPHRGLFLVWGASCVHHVHSAESAPPERELVRARLPTFYHVLFALLSDVCRFLRNQSVTSAYKLRPIFFWCFVRYIK